MELDIEVMRPQEMTPALRSAWQAVQSESTDLESPFFSFEFTQAVAAARSDAYVGVLRDHERVAGFFPFHARRSGVGAPIGGPICDYQGVVAKLKTPLAPRQLLSGCKLKAYDFNHVPTSQTAFHSSAIAEYASPILDLSDGFEAYRAQRARAGTKELKNAERKMRKMAREIGPLTFVANDRNPEAWKRMVDWKNASYARMRVASILNVGWVRECLQIIRETNAPDFSGMLSSLYADDRLVAVHFGMRSRTAWHWWFPTYDVILEKYSPGLALLLEMARWAPENGVERIDLGRGDSRYKRAFASTAAPLCEGSIELARSAPGLMRRARKICHGAAKMTGSERLVDFQRRAFNRLLAAGRLPN